MVIPHSLTASLTWVENQKKLLKMHWPNRRLKALKNVPQLYAQRVSERAENMWRLKLIFRKPFSIILLANAKGLKLKFRPYKRLCFKQVNVRKQYQLQIACAIILDLQICIVFHAVTFTVK